MDPDAARPPGGEVTRLLHAAVVYDDLRVLAGRQLRRELGPRQRQVVECRELYGPPAD